MCIKYRVECFLLEGKSIGDVARPNEGLCRGFRSAPALADLSAGVTKNDTNSGVKQPRLSLTVWKGPRRENGLGPRRA